MNDTSSPAPNILETAFAPIVLATIALLNVVFADGTSVGYGAGLALGKFLSSLALALPIFLIARYFSRFGRSLSPRSSISLVCLLTSAVWLLQLAAAFALAHRPASMMTEAKLAPVPISSTSSEELPPCVTVITQTMLERLRVTYPGVADDKLMRAYRATYGKPGDPIECKQPPFTADGKASPQEADLPICKGFFDHTEGVRCRPRLPEAQTK